MDGADEALSPIQPREPRRKPMTSRAVAVKSETSGADEDNDGVTLFDTMMGRLSMIRP